MKLWTRVKKYVLSMSQARQMLYSAIGVVVILMLAAAVIMRVIIDGLPSTHELEEYTPSLTTRVFDVNNQLIAEFSIEKRALLPINKIPVDMQNAVIAMEDNNFFKHWGISPRGIMRAVLRDVMHKRAAQGGSTITQQLSKLVFLRPEKTVLRKIREMMLAVQIEHRFSKQEILEMYLNQIYFGEGAYGLQAAAKRYFAKEVKDLSLAECAMLTGLIPSPGRYSPFNKPENALWRRGLVLQRMLEEGYITAAEKQEADKVQLPSEKIPPGTQAPYFVEHVRQLMEQKYGSALYKSGMKIYTTLDLKAQLVAERVMEERLKAIDDEIALEMAKGRHSNDDFDSPTSTAPLKLQGSFVAMDMKTGGVRVLIGGRDFDESKFNRAIQAKRQPGSSFKPFVWMAALMHGYTPATIVDDVPMAYYFDGRDWRLFDSATDQYSIALATQPFVGNKDFQIWVPNNFDNKSMGKITLRRGLELSRNLVSVNLIDKIGSPVVIDVAKKAGVLQPLQPVLSLGLGTSAVPLMEMVNAIGTFGNGGIKVEPYFVSRVEDAQGKVMEQFTPIETEVFSPQHSFVLTNMMRGVVERGTATRARDLKRPLAGKTGTSQDHRDMWFIGMTPDIVAGAWMGYDDFSTLENKDWTGGGTVVPWWTEIMAEVLKDQPAREFPVPDGISFVIIDPESGKLALPTCKKKFMEAFVKGTEPTTFCDIYH